jgi:hypothetical protein
MMTWLLAWPTLTWALASSELLPCSAILLLALLVDSGPAVMSGNCKHSAHRLCSVHGQLV